MRRLPLIFAAICLKRPPLHIHCGQGVQKRAVNDLMIVCQKGVCQKNNLICVVLYRVSANFFHRLRLIFERIFSHTVCTLTLFKSSKAKSDCLGYSLLGGGAVKRCSPVELIYWVYLYKHL